MRISFLVSHHLIPSDHVRRSFHLLVHMITWLSRTITNTGVEPGSPSSEVIPKLQEYTGGHTFDPVVGKYWESVYPALS